MSSAVDALIERMAADAHREIGAMVARARRDTDRRFDAVQRFTNRSIGQRRRYLVALQNMEKRNE